MACGDVLSLEDLQTAKKHQIFEAEVVTGKAGGVAGGASIDYATNQVTGQTQKTLPAVLRDAGFRPAPFTFVTGGVLAVGDSDMAVLWPISAGGDGQYYIWKGVYPKTVPAGSTPAASGGVSASGWLPLGDITLRSELSGVAGSSLIGSTSYAGVRAYGGDLNTVNVYGASNIFDGGSGVFKVDISDTISPDNGGTILVDAVGRRWKRIYSGAVNVLWFGADRNGVEDSIDAFNRCVSFVSTAKKKAMYSPSGEYKLSATLLFDYPEIEFFGDGRYLTKLKFSNPGIAVKFSDAHPNNNEFTFGGHIRDMWISGNASTTALLYVQPNHFNATDINLSEASPTNGAGLHILGTVLGCFTRVYCSSNTVPMANKPNVGILVDKDPVTLRRATANSFMHCVIEGMTGDGIQLVESDQSMFIGGTSENNGGNGVTITSTSRMNTFISVSFEHHAASSPADIYDAGYSNRFVNCYSSKNIIIAPSSLFSKVEGGFHQSVIVQGDFATIQDLKYSFFAAGGSVSIKRNTSYRNLFNANTSALTFPLKTPEYVTPGPSPFLVNNGDGVDIDIVVYGGTVTALTYMQGGATAVANHGGGNNTVRVKPGDALLVTYTGTPSITKLFQGVNYS